MPIPVAPRAGVREINACPTPQRRSDIAWAWIGRQHSLSDTAIRKRAGERVDPGPLVRRVVRTPTRACVRARVGLQLGPGTSVGPRRTPELRTALRSACGGRRVSLVTVGRFEHLDCGHADQIGQGGGRVPRGKEWKWPGCASGTANPASLTEKNSAT
jgi:hypothetical protein